MKREIRNLKIACILCAFVVNASAQSLVFSNQTIIVEPEQLSVESVEFQPLEIVTNTVMSWEDVIVITTNGWMDGGEVVTNTMQQQVYTDVITTNASLWTCSVIFSLPKGTQWALNDFPVTIERFKTRLRVPVDPAAVEETFGPAAAGLEFAASNGAYAPSGQVKDAFLSFVASVLGQ